MPPRMAGAGAPQGLSWSWELDFDVLLAALADAAPSPAGNSGASPLAGRCPPRHTPFAGHPDGTVRPAPAAGRQHRC
jgi:hypothetical protein